MIKNNNKEKDKDLLYGCSITHIPMIFIVFLGYINNIDKFQGFDKQIGKIIRKQYKGHKNFTGWYKKNKIDINASCKNISDSIEKSIATITDCFIDRKANNKLYWYEVETNVKWKHNGCSIQARTKQTASKTSGIREHTIKQASKRSNNDNVVCNEPSKKKTKNVNIYSRP